jgi:molybdopterin-guanine dinucleotide biosynthesis protein A
MTRTLVIQAGGESRRMGHDKALLPFCGVPLIERILQRLNGLAEEVCITSNQPDSFIYLGLPVFADIFPGKGALGGLYTALASATNPELIVVASDMPFVSARLLSAECDLLATTRSDAVIPISSYGFEPLHAVYRRETCLAAVQSALEEGQMRLSSWFSKVQVYKMAPDEADIYDPDLRSFINVNTPVEFQYAETLARMIGIDR